ncbi:MAG TPA: hypothetical protein VGB07_03595 [Blastocatellia bacterium]|jgi:hypothetical protein
MLIKPNRTIFTGHVRAIRPEADGWGANVELLVEQNESASREEDFLRPEPGTVLIVFAAEPDKLQVGEHIRAEVTLHAGPFGNRTVLETVAHLPKSTSAPAKP